MQRPCAICRLPFGFEAVKGDNNKQTEEHGPLPPAVCYTASTHNRVPGTSGAVAAVALKGCFEHSRSCMLAAVGRNSLTEVEMPSQSGVDSPVPSNLDLVTSEKSSALILVTVLGIWGGESLSVSSDSRVRPLFQGVWPLLNCDLILLRSPFIVIVSDRTNEL
ncbi:uncharacterized protein [Haliotis cracherodii]|uniref:uncharacterized protein n=1 Tax=Haliotis cracherodii TaxID=6455 RepID=UPI0039E90559